MNDSRRISTHLDRLREIVGCERALTGISQSLHFAVNQVRPSIVGAMHVTCADESELECANAFQTGFVRYVAPNLKTGQQSAFRLANLGGQYEWGSIRVAEDHFAAASPPSDPILLVVKLNSHVGVQKTADGPVYGAIRRYDAESTCCGALASLLADGHQPFVECLREAFQSEGIDRLAMLRDGDVVVPAERALIAGLVSARLQARKAILDVQDHTPAGPTRYIILPCVTINRPERDTEIVCGLYSAEHDGTTCNADYFGLGDDPSVFEVVHGVHGVTVTDPNLGTKRAARDHRALAEEWHAALPAPTSIPSEELDAIRSAAPAAGYGKRHHAKAVLGALLPVVSTVAPVSAVALLFAKGLAGIHHAFRMQRIMKEVNSSAEARRLLSEIHDKVDRLDPEQAEAMVKLLLAEHGG